MNAIFTRRSVRKYTGEPLPEEVITQLLKAAMRAPSARNAQPWEFVVVRQRATMEAVVQFNPYAAMLREAACMVVVCGNLARQESRNDFWVQDCSAATENLLLEAESLGVGGVWTALYPVEERVEGMQSLLHLPEHVIPLCAVALGMPAEKPAPVDTYRPEWVHLEGWEEK